MENQELVSRAIKARRLSYSPYSNFKVGSVVLCRDGKIYEGANIENSSYPLCMCGERNAIYHALMNGEAKEDILAVAIVGDSIGVTAPCGACRQVISELLNEDSLVILGNVKGDMEVHQVKELLPFAFSKKDLGK